MARFWRWWWFGGKDLCRELWYRFQILLVVTFSAWVVYTYFWR